MKNKSDVVCIELRRFFVCHFFYYDKEKILFYTIIVYFIGGGEYARLTGKVTRQKQS